MFSLWSVFYPVSNTGQVVIQTFKLRQYSKARISGDLISKFVSTSYVESQNLSMRMHMRRFTRLTIAFSKKIENHCHAIALYFVYYIFAKIHSSLSITPAMQAGLAKRVMSIEDIANLASIETPKKKGSYKKK